jgi:hypothetical protein
MKISIGSSRIRINGNTCEDNVQQGEKDIKVCAAALFSGRLMVAARVFNNESFILIEVTQRIRGCCHGFGE